ncbi:MAG: tRNA (adenosine(37)-N6)-threonylcarbamoyltransferase complex transferase subunit TsaD [Candidatus Pacebacteria bacterium]|nr:tRNA (adenosine(37)-N6)-threonylcarbamoyltransferase complex transferase subunit TsaD [Candidatus Paceibacterota bacterium]
MKILAIETSCDETAISILQIKDRSFEVLSHVVHSQIDMHREYGGVFPTIAKREHGKNLVPVLIEALEKADLLKQEKGMLTKDMEKILSKNPELLDSFSKNAINIDKPDIDRLAVTEGPGLEPALWAGISFAKALGILWDIDVYPVNHMEGHLASALLEDEVDFPAMALLVSGGHTELVLASSWGKYEILGRTLDDAVGEAFDKVARLLGLPYPGGPDISKLAKIHRSKYPESDYFKLPRPMVSSGDLKFSFSGIKTAVRYALEKEEITKDIQEKMAREFEDAVVEVFKKKVEKALEEYPVKTFILAGGVSANLYLQENLKKVVSDIKFITPNNKLSTDNATMIALAAYISPKKPYDIVARGNLRIDED